MIKIGEINTLAVLRETRIGLFLGDGEGNDILLPNKYVPENLEVGDEVSVFCYRDNEGRPIATTREPLVMANEFEMLRAVEVGEFGAFMDWGIEKHLLVPFREQQTRLLPGRSYIVYCYLDPKSDRLVGSTKLERFLQNDDLEVKEGDVVEVLIYRKTEMGWEVIIEDRHKGLVYTNEVFKRVAVGDRTKGVIRKIRPDHKIDVSLQPLGIDVLEPSANKIYETLRANGGFLQLHDKSDPQTITDTLQMSKKTFKKGVGVLYKARKIEILDNGIKLV